MSKSTKIKVGSQVQCRFLGSKISAVIIAERADGNFDARTTNGTMLPGINWYDPDNKKKPWFIESFNGVTVQFDLPKDDVSESKQTMTELEQTFAEQKKFIRGKLKK